MKKRHLLPLLMVMVLVFNYRSDAQTSAVKEELAKAQDLLKQGNTEEASGIFLRLMQDYPHNREAVQGWLMINMKRSPTGEEEAIKQLEELQKTYPNNTAILFFKTFIQAEYGHYDEALAGYDKLIVLQPDTALNWIGKGQILSEMNRFDEALMALEKATSLDPGRADIWGMQASVLAKLKKYDEAILIFNKAVELAPGFAGNIYNRACVYCLKGDVAKSLADLQKAISLNPQFKSYAPKDEDFRSLWDNEAFKKLTSQ